jgi:hypothetical protein
MMRYAALALLLVALAQPAGAQDLGGWWRGYKNTLENLRPLAERGDAKAQNNLGMLSQYPTLFKTPTLSTVSEDCLV